MDDLDRELAELLGLDEDYFAMFDFSNYVESSVENANNIYNDGNYMAYLPILSGLGVFKMEKRPGAGHNFRAVIDAIHNCYKKNPNGGYDKGYIEGIHALIRVSSSKVASLEQLLNILFYQLRKEKNGTAEFVIDIDEIMVLVNKLIKDNKDTYRKDYAMFDSWLERYKKSAFEKYDLLLAE